MHGELNYQIYVIRLHFCLVRCLISADRAAFLALVNDNISMFGIKLREDRFKQAAAFGSAIAGIIVNVQGIQAFRAVIARGVAERLDLKAAVLAYEAGIVFSESFGFHISRDIRDGRAAPR